MEDNGCPLGSEISLTVRIFVRDSAQTASFYAGPDRTMGREDTITLLGLDTFNVGQQAYWKSLGDGYFSDSLAALSTYHLGQADRNKCEIQVLRIPLTSSSCRSMDPDTMVIHRWQGGLSIHKDSMISTPDSATLLGIMEQDTIYTGWWTTGGDGYFSDTSVALITYHYGAQDMANCGAWIYLNSNSPAACSETKDSIWLQVGNNHTPIQLTYSLSSFAADTIFLNLTVGTNQQVNWYSAGAGTWIVDSVNHTALYFPSAAEKTAGTATIWATQVVYCDSNVDSDTVYVNFSPSSIRQELAISLHLYPNPTDGQLHLESPDLNQVREMKVFDTQGKELKLIPYLEADTYTWDVSGLSQGMYVLVVTDQEGNKIALRFIAR
ncbi:MAG TPA: hypothetical protein DIW47_00985 [Bacteroidetes bacterium]|nr:hypothetical protein [Bacteroidota bacterium]